MKLRTALVSALAGIALSVACSTSTAGTKDDSEECTPGEKGCACAEDDSCDGALVCTQGLCLAASMSVDEPSMGGMGAGGEAAEMTMGTGGDAAGDSVAPKVVSASPEGTLLDGRSPIVVTFDEAIEADIADIRVVLDTAITIAGELEVDGPRLVFRPSLPMNGLGNYVVEVGTGVKDLAGNPLSEEYSFDFTSHASGTGGGKTTRLDTLGTGDVSCPHLAMDENGNAMVLFQQGEMLYTAYYRAGIGWEPTQELAEATNGALAMSRGGRPAVVYTDNVSATERVILRLGDELGEPSLSNPILADTGSLRPLNTSGQCSLSRQDVNVAVNDAGAAAIAWRGLQGTTGDPSKGMVHSYKPVGTAVGVPAFSVTYPFSTYTARPAIAMNEAGDTQLSFPNFNGGDPALNRTTYAASGASWATATEISLRSASLVHAGVDSSDYFLTTYQRLVPGPTFDDHLIVENEQFGGTPSRSGYVDEQGPTASTPELFQSVQNAPWVAWKRGDNIGVTGYFEMEARFEANTSFINSPHAENVVIVGVEGAAGSETQAIVAYESQSEIRWALAKVNEYFIRDPDTIGTLDSGDAEAHDPRIAYDIPGRHGILLWTQVDADGTQLNVTDFHRRPPSTP